MDTIEDTVSTISWHVDLVRQNQDAIAYEYLRLDPDEDKILACREEIWFHTSEIEKHNKILLVLHITELFSI